MQKQDQCTFKHALTLKMLPKNSEKKRLVVYNHTLCIISDYNQCIGLCQSSGETLCKDLRLKIKRTAHLKVKTTGHMSSVKNLYY